MDDIPEQIRELQENVIIGTVSDLAERGEADGKCNDSHRNDRDS